MILSGNKRCMRDFILGINMLSNMRLCSNVPAQSIVQTALGGYQSVNEYIRSGGRVYEQRNYVYEALNAIDGITAVKPKAAFYIFPKMDVKKFNITDDEQFALDLLHEKKILITRGPAASTGESRTISGSSTCRAWACSRSRWRIWPISSPITVSRRSR